MRRSCNVQSFVSALLEGCPEIFMSHGFLSCDVMPATVLLVVSTIARSEERRRERVSDTV